MEDILMKNGSEPETGPDAGPGTEKSPQSLVTETPVKPSLRDRFAYPLMLVVGVLAAGGISFLVQSGMISWNGGHQAAASSDGPRMARVVYINTGQIMADVLQSQMNSNLTRHQAAEMGHIIGLTVQQIASGYAKQGDVVLSHNVLAVPESNNVTAEALAAVKARLANQFGGDGG